MSSSRIYPEWKEVIMKGTGGGLSGANIKAVLIDEADYTYNAAHDHLNDVAALARVATSANLSGLAIAGANVDFTDFAWNSVTGDQSEAVIFYIDSGASATNDLVAYIGSDDVSGLPVTPNGASITFAVSGSGLFNL